MPNVVKRQSVVQLWIYLTILYTFALSRESEKNYEFLARKREKCEKTFCPILWWNYPSRQKFQFFFLFCALIFFRIQNWDTLYNTFFWKIYFYRLQIFLARIACFHWKSPLFIEIRQFLRLKIMEFWQLS